MKGNQCDMCRKFSTRDPGWLAIIQYKENSWGNPFSGPAYDTEGTFCSMKCLAECAYLYVTLNDQSKTSATD